MRVLLTTDTIGGVWTFTRELAQELLGLGHDVALASFGRKPAAYQQEWCDKLREQFGQKFLFSASDAPLEWMPGNEFTFGHGESVLLDLCEQFMPDLVHSNQFCWGALNVSIPKIITAHSDVLSWAEACRKKELADCDWLRCYRRLVQKGLDGACTVTAPTLWMAGALRKNFAVHGDLCVIPNGRSRCGFATDRPRLPRAVSSGRLWDEGKGLRTLLNVKSVMPIVLAGDSSFQTESTEIPLPFAGPLSESELFGLFQQSSVYIAASLYEPFGLAPLEAALCGCVVVARDLPSLREVWGEAALYFRDTRQLELILDTLATCPTRLHAARAASMRRAQRFSAEKMATAYIALYGEVLRAGCGEEIVADAA